MDKGGSGPSSYDYDVAIIGGGPGGSTTGAFLCKYNPGMRVAIFEKEKFPREHIGESQLPPIGAVLAEMGCWDKVEAANFPIKVGATYRWGQSEKLWDFDFLPPKMFRNEARPAKFAGQRRVTAFQVDRAIYDDILLRHAEELGCKVFEETRVLRVEHEGDRVTAFIVEDEQGQRRITARWYIDASGHAGTLRRDLGVKIDVPTKLMNIAIWDYWTNTDWAVEIGVGGTRIQIMSMENGWIWFIPLGPTRTSIGFVCPQGYYKKCGLTPEQIYTRAVQTQPRIAALCRNGTREGRVRTTKDWSFVADRLAGENWFLVGEAAGFADPILSGGLTLTHTGAREAAYMMLAIDRGEHDAAWLKEHYNERQRRRVLQYIRFADFWYSFNGQFTDLEDFTSEIAKASGVSLDSKRAFRWLSFGGFAHEDFLFPGLGSLDLLSVKEVTRLFAGEQQIDWEINRFNDFRLDLSGAERRDMPVLHLGKITKAECLVREGRWLPQVGLYRMVVDTVRTCHDLPAIGAELKARIARMQQGPNWNAGHILLQAMSTLEALVLEGWVKGSVVQGRPMVKYVPIDPMADTCLHANVDQLPEEGFSVVPSSRAT